MGLEPNTKKREVEALGTKYAGGCCQASVGCCSHPGAWVGLGLIWAWSSEGEKRCLQLNQLDEFRGHAYDLALSYKERTKRAHDKRIIRREFKVGEAVLLYNSRLRLFPGKLKSRWSGPFTIAKVFPSGAVVLHDGKEGTFTVNAQRLKHYIGGTIEPQIGVTRHHDSH
ncbi:uncharacterized protein [Primulina eburnea]|uniref:uncharacterized protein n=1 Tax=Primulina eburnea TaxID=1245227 RepID=UPI003C6BEBF3